MDQSSDVPSMGWTRKSAGVTVLLAMDEHRKRVGERTIKRREELGLTQEDLAQRAGTSVKTISRFENGRHEGRLDTINKIAKALDVDRAELIGQAPAPLAIGEQTQLDRIEAMLAELLQRTTPNESLADVAGKATQRRGGKRSKPDASRPAPRDSDQAA